MDVSKKLVELLREAPYNIYGNKLGHCYFNSCLKLIADHLIANGVTVQEWIPVNERLPDKPMKCLVYTKRGDCGGYDISYYNQGFYSQYANVTHWMPMPEPPKEGAEG